MFEKRGKKILFRTNSRARLLNTIVNLYANSSWSFVNHEFRTLQFTCNNNNCRRNEENYTRDSQNYTPRISTTEISLDDLEKLNGITGNPQRQLLSLERKEEEKEEKRVQRWVTSCRRRSISHPIQVRPGETGSAALSGESWRTRSRLSPISFCQVGWNFLFQFQRVENIRTLPLIDIYYILLYQSSAPYTLPVWNKNVTNILKSAIDFYNLITLALPANGCINSSFK